MQNGWPQNWIFCPDLQRENKKDDDRNNKEEYSNDEESKHDEYDHDDHDDDDNHDGHVDDDGKWPSDWAQPAVCTHVLLIWTISPTGTNYCPPEVGVIS